MVPGVSVWPVARAVKKSAIRPLVGSAMVSVGPGDV
jgi:hypothetical protein